MWRLTLLLGLLAVPGPTLAQSVPSVSGTWALDPDLAAASYVLAARGTPGTFLICFDSGNVRRIVVAVGDDRSHLARGSCTVLLPTPDDGIVVDFAAAADQSPHGIALGTFQVILPKED